MVEHSPKILAREDKATTLNSVCVCVCLFVSVCVCVCVCACVSEGGARVIRGRCFSIITATCICAEGGGVTGCSSRITATWTKKDVDQEVLLHSLLADKYLCKIDTPIAPNGLLQYVQANCSCLVYVQVCPKVP